MRVDRDVPNLPAFAALRTWIAQERAKDPLAGPKLGSQIALDKLVERLTTDRGVHAETLMARAGVVMGQSVQASLWAEALEAGQTRVPEVREVCCENGSRYLVGDPLNRRLTEGYGSPWELLKEAARQEGHEDVPNRDEMLLDGIRRLGTPAFGVPRVPEAHIPQALDGEERQEFWWLIQPLCESCCSAPEEWPLLGGLIAARALRLVTSHLDPALAFQLAMDSAIDAAKIPLEPAAEGGAGPIPGRWPS